MMSSSGLSNRSLIFHSLSLAAPYQTSAAAIGCSAA
jgi:hypothetical protein